MAEQVLVQYTTVSAGVPYHIVDFLPERGFVVALEAEEEAAHIGQAAVLEVLQEGAQEYLGALGVVVEPLVVGALEQHI
jgi:hypothetical protein